MGEEARASWCLIFYLLISFFIISKKHLLFVDNTSMFYDASKEHIELLSCGFMWLEVVSGLKITLYKSKLIPMREVPNYEKLARALGCKVGSLPSYYLGFPLGVACKSLHV